MKRKKQQKSRKTIIIGVISIFFVLLFTTFVVNNSQIRDFVFGSFARTTSPTVTNDSNYLIGAYYMPKPQNVSHQFQEVLDYNRTQVVHTEKRITKPFLGYYSGTDQRVMDQQIQWASDFGIDYWTFDEYWVLGKNIPVYGESMNSFLNSAKTNKLKFIAMVTNLTAPPNLPDVSRVRANFFTNTMAAYYKNNYFNKSNYLKINQKPVVTIYTNVFAAEWNDTSKINGYLKAFEQTAGTDIYWIYGGSDVTSDPSVLVKYKERGFDALAPYNMSPDVTFSNGQPMRTKIEYSDYVAEAMNQNKAVYNASQVAGVSFIPDVTMNFDERLLWYKHPSIHKRPYTVNGNVSLYKGYLLNMKSFVDSKKFGEVLVKNETQKILVNLGAWNEWIEGSYIEPGYGPLSQTDPYAILKTIASVFEPSKANAPTIAYKDYSPTLPRKETWKMGTSDFNDWYIPPYAYVVTPESKTHSTIVVASINKGIAIEGATNINVDGFKGVSLTTNNACRGLQGNCIVSIGMTWFTTSCTGDNPSTCTDKNNPVKQGTIFLNPSKCTNNGKRAEWGRCDFIIPEGTGKWSDRLELIRFVFNFKDATQNPTSIGIGEVKLIPR